MDAWLPNQSALYQHWTALEWKGRFVKLSKTLAYMLRFGAQKNGLTLRPDAYIAVATLLAHGQFRGFGYLMEEVLIAVEKNVKERFAVKKEGEVWLIRAQQGMEAEWGRLISVQSTQSLLFQMCQTLSSMELSGLTCRQFSVKG